jgi:hypothetical protein
MIKTARGCVSHLGDDLPGHQSHWTAGQYSTNSAWFGDMFHGVGHPEVEEFLPPGEPFFVCRGEIGFRSLSRRCEGKELVHYIWIGAAVSTISRRFAIASPAQ